MARLLIFFIACYRRFLTPWKPKCCRFEPTCSQYAIQALAEHGTLKGTLLTTWRILRCHPWAKWGQDPVPPHGSWSHPQRSLHDP